MYGDLAGKTACVTGAGREAGIGAAIAKRLAAEGCKVVVSDIGVASGEEMPASAIGEMTELESVVKEICSSGGEAVAVSCNVLDESEVSNLCQAAKSHFGSLDIVVNNAGIGYLMSPIVETSAEAWDAVLGVNLRGAFLVTKHAAKIMIEQGRGGRIINVASQAAKSGFPFAAAYCSSKHGMVGLTRVAAIELGKEGITVNAVCPNHITTGLGQWQNEFFSDALGMTMDEYMAGMRSRIPLGRPGLTADIAKACAYLCSEQAQYITGEALNVSGGEEMH